MNSGTFFLCHPWERTWLSKGMSRYFCMSTFLPASVQPKWIKYEMCMFTYSLQSNFWKQFLVGHFPYWSRAPAERKLINSNPLIWLVHTEILRQASDKFPVSALQDKSQNWVLLFSNPTFNIHNEGWTSSSQSAPSLGGLKYWGLKYWARCL